MNIPIRKVFESKWFVPSVCGAAAFGGGVAVGIFLGRKKTANIDEKLEGMEQMTLDLNESVDKVIRRIEQDVIEKRERPTYVINAENLETVVIEEPTPQEGQLVNVFPSREIDWDYDAEIASRVDGMPYVIHQDEFYGDELGWDNQSTLTWYATDSVLVGEHDEVIYNPDELIGPLRFGHGSANANVFFVRNETLHSEYEILYDPGSYEAIVLGVQIETAMERDDLKHSRQPGKFRGD